MQRQLDQGQLGGQKLLNFLEAITRHVGLHDRDAAAVVVSPSMAMVACLAAFLHSCLASQFGRRHRPPYNTFFFNEAHIQYCSAHFTIDAYVAPTKRVALCEQKMMKKKGKEPVHRIYYPF